MPIDFPNAPTVNQIFSAGSLQYRWTGAVWADNLTASITYDAVTNKPATFTPSAHTHQPADIVGTAVITTDTRLSNARTPLAHTHLLSQITDYVAPVIPEVTFTNNFMTMGA